MCLFVGCGRDLEKAKGRTKGPEAAPVRVADVRREQVPLEIRAIGNVEAWNAVEVKSRVAGQIAKVFFEEGQDVKQGQMLFQIDPSEFEQVVRQVQAEIEAQKASLVQAEANYQRDVATAKNARAQAQRYADLATKGIVSREQNDQYQTQALAAEKAALASQAAIGSAQAAIQGAESKLDDARLQLSYTSIRAPITGRTGNLTSKTGNLVVANATTALVVINQITPVYATFTVPESDLNQLRQYSSTGKLQVEALPAQSSDPAAVGVLNFVDNEVDAATGTIRLKGRFENTNRALWPGQFVNVVVRLASPQQIVVPSAAVRNAQAGNYVFVVKPDSTAEQRVITASRSWRDLTVVSEGVKPGEKVIVEGQLRVKPGTKVQIRSGDAEDVPAKTASVEVQ